MIIELVTAQREFICDCPIGLLCLTSELSVYVNSFFAVLNSRNHLRDIAAQEPIHFTSLRWPTGISRGSQVEQSNVTEGVPAEGMKYSTGGSDVDNVAATMVVNP